MSMIWIVIDVTGLLALASTQFTTVPFKPMLVELMDNVEIRGEAN